MVRSLPKTLARYRGPASFVANVGLIAIAYTLAYLLRFDLTIPRNERHAFLVTLPASIVIQYAAFRIFKLTRGWWRYVGIGDFLNAVKSATAATVVLAAGVFSFQIVGYPRSVFVIYWVLIIGLSIGARLGVRLWRQVPLERESGTRKRLLIIGAGDTGEALLREIRSGGRLNYHAVAFIDDDVRKRGAYIDGVPVVDTVDAAADVCERFEIDEMIVATPSASGDAMRRVIEKCRATGKPFKVMPATWEVLAGRAGVSAARDVEINDLLRRPPVALDLPAIGLFLEGKRVLVTGAAGSIGSEICRQTLRFNPASLTCLDHDENALFFLERSLAKLESNVNIRYRLGDISDGAHMDALFAVTKPQVVFHAAAHKHVPMIEGNPVEGVRNNVFGTETVATIAGRHGAEAFLLISTDKAVNPSSVMGASKRIAERMIQTLPFETRYAAVRFGNVLGSQGSVVPLLKEQIAQGGPVTVTHPDMRRYFMTIPEAVELVIQAAAMCKGDEVFMLDMGEPVKIVDLAKDLITLSGLRPGVDIEIVFSGVRPGEKLYEELYLEAETADRTTHPKILVAKHVEFERKPFDKLLDDMRRAVDANEESAVRRLLPELVPEYQKQAAGSSNNVIPLAGRPRAQTKPQSL